MNEIIYSIASNKEWAWTLQPGLPKYTLTRGQVAWAMANAYLNPEMRWIYMDWSRLRQSHHPLAKQRLDCLLDYFTRIQKVWGTELLNQEVVEYELVRHTHYDTTLVKGQSFGENLEVEIHVDRMEEGINSQDTAIVDFANARLHIHSITPSVTQEELLFSIHSECFLGLCLFPKEMEDDECIVFRNVWQHADYTGYLETFRFAGPLKEEKRVATIIAMDALMGRQWERFERDIRKAYLGFSAVSSPIVSTGNWGCGAFGGNPTLKFIQQVMAAQWAGKTKLRYSTFGNPRQRANLHNLLLNIRKLKDITWEWMFETLEGYNPERMDFERYIEGEILYQELKE